MRKKDVDVLKRLIKGGTLYYEPYRGRFNPRSYFFFGEDFFKIPESTIDRLMKKGWIEKDEKGIRVTEKGLNILASIKQDSFQKIRKDEP